ncbi:ABC transporter permease [Flagellimonas sp.]|uniref:ABC transporter permease n=1 Tax=Flagellimonas sp. TaxID=2058762 RepID=UPI003BB136FC
MMLQEHEHSNWQESFKKAFKNEWKAITKDKAVVLTFVSMAVLILVIYSIVYNKEVVYDVPVAAIDQDFSKSSREFIQMVNANPSVKTVGRYPDLATAKKAMYSGKVSGIFIIPARFGQEIATNKQPTVSVYADASNLILYRAVYGSVAIAQGYFNGDIKVKRAIASGGGLSSVAPVATVTTNLFNPAGGYGTYLIPTVTALILQLVILLAIGILGGTYFEQKIEAETTLRPRRPMIILLGRASTYLSIFLVLLPIQFGLIFYLFSFPLRASLGSIYLFALPYIMALVFLGIFISYFFKRREDAILFLSILAIPALMLSGLSYPYEGLNPLFKYTSELLPSTSGARGLVKLTQMGAPFNEVNIEWARLWGLTLLYFLLAAFTLRFKRRTVYLT